MTTGPVEPTDAAAPDEDAADAGRSPGVQPAVPPGWMPTTGYV